MDISDLADYLSDHESSHKEQFEGRFGTRAEEFVDQKKKGFRELLIGIAQEFLSERKFAEVTGTATDGESYFTTMTEHHEIPSYGAAERKFAEITATVTDAESCVMTMTEKPEMSPPGTAEMRSAKVTGTATDAESYITTEHREGSPHTTSERKVADVTEAVPDAGSHVTTTTERRESSPHGTIRSLSNSSESEAYVVLTRTFTEPPVIETEQMLESLLRIIAKHFLRPLGQVEFADAKPDDKLKALIGGLTRDHFHPCQDIPQRVQSVLTSGHLAHALIERREYMLGDLLQKMCDHPTLSLAAVNMLERTIVIINPDCINPDELHPNDIHPDEIDPEDDEVDSPSHDMSVAKYFVRMEDVLRHLINRFDNDPHPFETDQELEELSSRVEAIRKGHCYRFSKKRLAKLFKKGLIMGPPLSLVRSSLMAEFGLQMP